MAETCVHKIPEKIVVIGDLQGNIEGLDAILEAAGLVDGSGTWAAGDAHLVQLGDIFGRASEPKECCDRLRELARRAANAGGRVHVLLGNHEAEVVHRYEFECGAQEYLNFATQASLAAWEHNRDAAEEAFWDMSEDRSMPISNLVAAWELLHPLGRDEFRAALKPSGQYGRWLCSLPAAIQIGTLLFSHAGLLPKWTGDGLDALNARARREMALDAYFAEMPEESILIAPDGPLWCRALAWGGKGVRRALAMVLRRHGAAAQIVGHTPTLDGWIHARYSRRVVCVDTGIGQRKSGRLSALVVTDGAFWALYPPKKPRLMGPVPEPLG